MNVQRTAANIDFVLRSDLGENKIAVSCALQCSAIQGDIAVIERNCGDANTSAIHNRPAVGEAKLTADNHTKSACELHNSYCAAKYLQYALSTCVAIKGAPSSDFDSYPKLTFPEYTSTSQSGTRLPMTMASSSSGNRPHRR